MVADDFLHDHEEHFELGGIFLQVDAIAGDAQAIGWVLVSRRTVAQVGFYFALPNNGNQLPSERRLLSQVLGRDGPGPRFTNALDLSHAFRL